MNCIGKDFPKERYILADKISNLIHLLIFYIGTKKLYYIFYLTCNGNYNYKLYFSFYQK